MTARAIIEDIQKLPRRERAKVFAWVDRKLGALKDDSPVPQLHKDLLDERVEEVRMGKAKFLDLETAKKQIADEIRRKR